MGQVHYPRAWVRAHVRVEDVGQPDPDRLIKLPHPPIELEVVENKWSEANTFRAVVDLEDFPLDPRIIRGVTFEVFLADAGSLDPDFWQKQSLDQMRSHAVCLGVVDEIQTRIDDDWRKTTLKGRDYTAYFLDVETEGKPVAYTGEDGAKLTLLEVLEKIKEQIPNAEAITFDVDPDVPTLYPADYHTRGTDEKLSTRKKRQGESAWEAMLELCLEGGLILYVELDKIRVRRPTTIFVNQGQDESTWWTWTLGQNLKSLQTSRNMGRQHGINVRVTSYCPDGDGGEKIRHANWPKNPVAKLETPASAVADDGEKQQKKTPKVVFTPYLVRGITSAAQLEVIAEQLYNLLRHHELEGEFETDDMVDSNDRPVMGLHYGDPVVFDFSEAFHSVLTLDRAEQVERLLAVGYDEETAQSVARALKSQTIPFYAHTIRHDFRSEDDGGYSLRVEIRSRKQVDYKLDADGNVVKDTGEET